MIYPLKTVLLKPFRSWKNKYLKNKYTRLAQIQNLREIASKEIEEYTGVLKEDVKKKISGRSV